MKGLVFTTFYSFVEEGHGADLLDEVIAASGVPNDGAYTSVGTYPFEQMVALVIAASRLTGQPLPALLESFGGYCFGCWVKTLPAHFEGRCLFDVLASIDDFHESEVRKLHADAELPSFRVESRDARRLTLRYISCKPLADLATGVIKRAAVHLNDPVSVRYETITDDAGNHMRFIIERSGAPV